MTDREPSAQSTRSLRAVLFSDMRGYSAMMSADEERALRLLRRSRGGPDGAPSMRRRKSSRRGSISRLQTAMIAARASQSRASARTKHDEDAEDGNFSGDDDASIRKDPWPKIL